MDHHDGNRVSVGTLSTNPPTATEMLGYDVMVLASGGNQRAIKISRIDLEHNP